MRVIKRDGRYEPVQFDKITKRIEALCTEFKLDIDPVPLAQKVIEGLYDGVTTKELDTLAAETAESKGLENAHFSKLAACIEISSLQKEVTGTFSDRIQLMANYTHPVTNKPAPLIEAKLAAIIEKNNDRLNKAIDYKRDYKFNYFGFMTLCRAYFLKMNGKPAERPQDFWMRVSMGIHYEDIDAAIETYEYFSNKKFIHATPTLFNSGTPKPQMSSCFLLTIKDDSIDGIFDTLKDCAKISKYAGGIGLSIHKIRAFGSYIGGTNGKSNGIIPMLRV